MKPENFHSVRNFFASHDRFIITAHIRPDGDATGSVIGLGLALQAIGKSVQMVIPDGAPSSYNFLYGFDQFSKTISNETDALITLDCSDMGRLSEQFKHLQPLLNIDHHFTNDNFAEINWVEPDASATAEILADHLPAWGLPITKTVAEALLMGIVIDTIGYKTSNVSEKTLRLSADLMGLGANLSMIYSKGLEARSYEAVQLWGYGISNLHVDGNLVWTNLTLEDRKASRYPGRDDADLINVLSSITQANVAVIFVEGNDGKIKVSWRSKLGYDVSKIAAGFGGGGHKAASGAEIKGSLEKVNQDVLEATKLLLQ